MTKYLISFDDTDMIGSIGTGHVLQGFLDEMKLDYDFISRHQLYVHEEIPYTSHNSSMCAKVSTKIPEADLIRSAGEYLRIHSPNGADPGLCVMEIPHTGSKIELVSWGQRAKRSVLTKEEAYALSRTLGIHLSEHGGTGQGVIGALAAIGLRLTGNDGRIRGRRELAAGEWSVGEILKRTGFQRVVALGEGVLHEDESILTTEESVKAVLRGFSSTVMVESVDGIYRPLSRDVLKKIS